MTRCARLVAFSVSFLSAAYASSGPRMPFAFVENHGQASSRVKVIGSGPQFKAWFDDDAVVLQQGAASLHVGFAGALPKPRIQLLEANGARANFLHGNDPRRWQTGLAMFNAVHYEGIWPGVDIEYRQENGTVKAEYTLAPGADLRSIALRFDGSAAIQEDGSLSVTNHTGEFRESAPVLYQETASGRKPVSGGFGLLGDGLVGFQADYDRTLPLIVDPAILFSGYFGGTGQDAITAVAVNSTYNVIVAGWTSSTDLPASGGARHYTGGGVDAFVASFSPATGQLVYCTYLGGTGDDRAFGIAVDAANNTYITGWTSSINFPVVGALQSTLKGARDAFVAKINPSGNALLYSTYLGGAGVDTGNAIAVDSFGQALIAGDTNSTNLPVTAGAFQRTFAGGQDVFVARLTASGAALSFMTYFGGSGAEHGTAVQVDPTGPIVIGGGTQSTNLPVYSAVQPASAGGQDGFVAKLNSTATALIFSTYLGGSGGSPGFPEQVNGLVLSSTGNVLAAGITSSSNFPTTSGVVQSAYGGGQTDGFVVRLASANGALLSSTFIGGTMNDGINAIGLFPQSGRVFVTGFTNSLDFPVHHGFQSVSAGGAAGSMDAFVVGFNNSLSLALYATYLGGSAGDTGNAIAVDAMGSVAIAGQTGSFDFPVSGGMGPVLTDPLSAFLTKVAPDWTLSVVSAPNGSIDASHTGNIGTAKTFSYGQTGDIPVAGDWTGTGIRRTGVFRNGLWILDTNGDGILNAGDKVVSFGQAGDIPVVGDWNGSGTIKLGLYRAGTFILDLSGHLSGIPTGVADAQFSFGLSTDIPVTGDWNAGGTTKVGVFRNGSWLIDYNGDQLLNTLDPVYTYGQTGDIPVTGSWDSSGLTRIGVYRAGTWILNIGGTNTPGATGQTDIYVSFGSAGMTPVVR